MEKIYKFKQYQFIHKQTNKQTRTNMQPTPVVQTTLSSSEKRNDDTLQQNVGSNKNEGGVKQTQSEDSNIKNDDVDEGDGGDSVVNSLYVETGRSTFAAEKEQKKKKYKPKQKSSSERPIWTMSEEQAQELERRKKLEEEMKEELEFQELMDYANNLDFDKCNEWCFLSTIRESYRFSN